MAKKRNMLIIAIAVCGFALPCAAPAYEFYSVKIAGTNVTVKEVTNGRVEGTDGDDVIFYIGRSGGSDIPYPVLIRGLQGNDVLFGGDNTDLINGGEGDDIIDGASDDDVVFGGPGADVFLFNDPISIYGSYLYPETIADFEPSKGDRIDLSMLDGNAQKPGKQPFHFIGSKPFSGAGGEARFEFDVLTVDMKDEVFEAIYVPMLDDRPLTASALILDEQSDAAKAVQARMAKAKEYIGLYWQEAEKNGYGIVD